MFTLALAVVTAVYVLFALWCAWQTVRATRPLELVPDDALPTAAVLVAARDEERVLARCLDALVGQDYPADRLTLLVADDHSTDATAAVVHGYAPDVRYVSVADADAPGLAGLRGKARALHAAIAATDAELLLMTDADCAPPPGWARGLASLLCEPGVGLAAGLTRVERPAAGWPRAFAGGQDLDSAYLLGYSSALTEAIQPATAMGNNMALRREAYEAVGGYPGLPFSVTEDYALFRAVAEAGPWRVRFPLAPETAVVTLPAPDVGAFYRQRRRWARGGAQAGVALYAVYTLAHLAHLLPLVALALAPGAGLVSIAAKCLADAVVFRSVLPRTRPSGAPSGFSLSAFGVFEALAFLYMATLPVALAMSPRIRWKGRLH